MNLIRNTLAKDATNLLILPIARLKAKAKASPLVRVPSRIIRKKMNIESTDLPVY
jgi:hypothetical protein